MRLFTLQNSSFFWGKSQNLDLERSTGHRVKLIRIAHDAAHDENNVEIEERFRAATCIAHIAHDAYDACCSYHVGLREEHGGFGSDRRYACSSWRYAGI